MRWRNRHKQRKTIFALQRLFTHDVDFNLSMHGLQLVDVEMNGMVLYTQQSPSDAMKWIHQNIPSMTDNSWFLYDVQRCDSHEEGCCNYIYVCCN